MAFADETTDCKMDRRHDRSGPNATTGDIADDKEEAMVVDGEHVVPVAADLHPRDPRDVAPSHFDPRNEWHVSREEGVLERFCDAALLSKQLLDLAAQLFGSHPSSNEPFGTERCGNGEKTAEDCHNPPEP